MDIAENGRMGAAVALPTGQAILERGCKDDGSLSQVKTNTYKGELYTASIYEDRRRPMRISLWNWMEANPSLGNWLICVDYNHTGFVEDSIGPTPLLHGSKIWTWNHLSEKFDFLDNRLVVVTKSRLHFTQQATYGSCFNQFRIDRKIKPTKHIGTTPGGPNPTILQL